MKKLWLMLFVAILVATPALAAGPGPVPGDYGITVRVVGSRTIFQDRSPAQELQVVIGGQQLELTSLPMNGVLALGEYKARYIDRAGKHANGYDMDEAYEFLFPDGKTRVYAVTAYGQREDAQGGSTPPVILRP